MPQRSMGLLGSPVRAHDHLRPSDGDVLYRVQRAWRVASYIEPWLRAGATTQAMVAGTYYACPFLLSRAITIDQLAFHVTSAGAGGVVVRVGIYADNGVFYPAALLKDAGTGAGDGTGVKAVTITGNYKLPKGIFWLVAQSDGAPTLRGALLAASPLGAQSSDFQNSLGQWRVAGSYGVLPSSFPAAATTASVGNFINPRLLSLD